MPTNGTGAAGNRNLLKTRWRLNSKNENENVQCHGPMPIIVD